MGYYAAGGNLSMMPSHNTTPPADTRGSSPRRAYRRMNPANVRALRRGMRRVQAFARLARGVMSFTHAHKMKKARRRR